MDRHKTARSAAWQVYREGFDLENTGRFSEAIQKYRLAMKMLPSGSNRSNDSKVFQANEARAQGRIHAEARDWDKAIQEFTKAARYNPSNANLKEWIAWGKDKKVKAVAAAQQAAIDKKAADKAATQHKKEQDERSRQYAESRRRAEEEVRRHELASQKMVKSKAASALKQMDRPALEAAIFGKKANPDIELIPLAADGAVPRSAWGQLNAMHQVVQRGVGIVGKYGEKEEIGTMDVFELKFLLDEAGNLAQGGIPKVAVHGGSPLGKLSLGAIKAGIERATEQSGHLIHLEQQHEAIAVIEEAARRKRGGETLTGQQREEVNKAVALIETPMALPPTPSEGQANLNPPDKDEKRNKKRSNLAEMARQLLGEETARTGDVEGLMNALQEEKSLVQVDVVNARDALDQTMGQLNAQFSGSTSEEAKPETREPPSPAVK